MTRSCKFVVIVNRESPFLDIPAFLLKLMRKAILFTVIIFLLSQALFSQNRVSSSSGNWTSSVWSGLSSPSTSSGWGTVQVNHDMIISTNYTITNDVYVNSSGSIAISGNLEVKGGGDLYVYGDLTVSGDVTLKKKVIIYPGGSMTILGNLEQTGGGDLDVYGDITIAGNVTLSAEMIVYPGGSTTIEGNINVAQSQNLTVGTSASSPPYADFVVKGNLNSTNSGDVVVNANGRVAVGGDVRDNGGGGTVITVQNQGQVYVDNNIVYSGGGSDIVNNNSSSPFGLYVNGSITNSGGGATTSSNNADQSTMVSTNTDFTTWITGVLGISLLPVTWGHISISSNASGILIRWNTYYELNNDRFEVQRSNDLFEWEVIGRVDGNGTTNFITSYEYKDNYCTPGAVYYRLKQVDYDGASDFSKVVTVNADLCMTENVEVVEISPNPSDGRFLISSCDETSSLFIFNDKGEIVKYEKAFSTEGIIVELSGYNAGVYVIHVIKQNENHFLKLVLR